MSFDTSYQNTGLSEGQGRPLATPESVTKHKAPIGGCRSTPPPIFRPTKTQKKRAEKLSFLSKSCRGLKGALPPADLLRYSEAGGNPQSSSPFEKGGRTPSLNFTLGALPQTPHSPCGRRERQHAFPSARAVCRSVPSRDG